MKVPALILVIAAFGAHAHSNDDYLAPEHATIAASIGRIDGGSLLCSEPRSTNCGRGWRSVARASAKAHPQVVGLSAQSASSPELSFTGVGEVKKLPSQLPVATLLGPKRIPPSSAPDVVGAFRFLCGPGQITYDDPIVYPGKPGKAHLHQFFGNLGADAHSTYESLRKSGESTCQNDLNRSAYWMPAMLDGKGNVVRPDYVSIYYKRRPSTDSFCKTSARGCVGIPRGLRFIFGWDQARPDEAQPENNRMFNFKCVQGWTPTTAAFPDMVEPMKVCRPGQWLSATIATPQCWNGTDLDTPDHRSHLADMRRNAKGVNSCPSSHPWIIPQFTMGVAYSIEPGDRPELWHLSSDAMLPDALRRPGASFHSDYFEAWDEDIRLRWEAACLDQQLNCSDGDLGDGQILVRGKHYPKKQISPRLVEMPQRIGPAADHVHGEGGTTG